ncbi:RNA polymerase sigma factor [Chitinophaga tropicalis]|uniref:Sigma-70 family RNA polymerase sigma factor n=1 Tax=Chitinophaga tropicalis TaxID=2683588 RepID=A0A7K1U7I4_9BACT|nr:RNA polymerase sigma factor [Chitinophaga tropicalis]MVT10302.1 sigma-70 family RNA polymerase sigma factor [Chitinophaga tropicalis]
MEKELQEDAQIVQGLKDGNPHVTGLFYRKYMPRIFNWALQFTGDRSSAQDITQNLFARIHQKLSNGESVNIKDRLDGYLHRITRNEYLNYIRGNKSYSERNQAYSEESLQTTDPVCIEEKELVTRLGKAIEELSPKRKKAVQLILIRGLKYKEAAEITGTSVNTLKIQVRDAVKELQNKFKQFFFLFL